MALTGLIDGGERHRQRAMLRSCGVETEVGQGFDGFRVLLGQGDLDGELVGFFRVVLAGSDLRGVAFNELRDVFRDIGEIKDGGFELGADHIVVSQWLL
jgi:hypothetical protein